MADRNYVAEATRRKRGILRGRILFYSIGNTWMDVRLVLPDLFKRSGKTILNCEKLTKSLLVLQCFLFYF